MASPTYAPLQGDGREFRLVVLEPSTDRLSPLRCELNRASFDDGDLKYTALSYVWGDPLVTGPILVNGLEIQVTLNLEAALRHIRQPSYAVVLWVDALCINQKDLAEKNHQVEMMREIFAGAELVVAWLGSASEDSDLATDMLGKGWKGWMESAGIQDTSIEGEGLSYSGSSNIKDSHENNTPVVSHEADCTTKPNLTSTFDGGMFRRRPRKRGIKSKTGRDSDDTPPGEMEYEFYLTGQPNIYTTNQPADGNDSTSSYRGYHWSYYWEQFTVAMKRLTTQEAVAISRLLKRSWWSRIWVIQEVFLAKKVVFKCGDAEVPGKQISSWRADALDALHVLCGDHGSTGTIFPAISLLDTLSYPRDESDNPMDYLFWYGRLEATKPHDYIYGLLGIIPETDRILVGAPDYGCKAERLFINVATKLMIEHHSLDLLLAAGMPVSLTAVSSTKMDLPSWVPDWTRPWLIFKDNQRDWGGIPSFSEPIFHFSEDEKELILHGFAFDVIDKVESVPALAQGKMPIWQAARESDDQGLPPLQRLIVALLLRYTNGERLENKEGFELFAAFFQELQEYHVSRSGYEANGGHNNPDYLAGFLDWIGETRNWRTDEEILKKVFSPVAALFFVAWYRTQSSTDLQRFYMHYTRFRDGTFGNAGFSLFRTLKGSFGLIRAAPCGGDLLCVVPTCRVPLVLRKVQSSKYVLVGPSCPMAGTIHGELAQAAEKGEITRELFTLV